MHRMYRVGEFAALTGVSVRTLHHYDHLGLLPPSAYSEAGYRLYSEQDLLRLQQILTLRYLGFPLKQIGALLDRPDFDVVASIRIQRGALRDRISELEQIEAALGELLERRLASGRWDWEMLTRASQTVQKELEQKGDKQMQEYYSPEEMKRQFDQLGKQIPPEQVRDVERRWSALLAEVRANRHLDPASPKAQELAERWDALLQETVQGWDQKLITSVAEGYRQGQYADIEDAPRPEDFTFIRRVHEARSDGD